MRKTLVFRAVVVAAALALIVFAPASSANARLPHWAPGAGSTTHFARAGLGATHWFGRGHYGSWGKRLARPHNKTSRNLLGLDQLQNPGNGEIMPTTNTYLIFWLPPGFHYGDPVSYTHLTLPTKA